MALFKGTAWIIALSEKAVYVMIVSGIAIFKVAFSERVIVSD